MIKRKPRHLESAESPHAARLAQRRVELEARKAAAIANTDMSLAMRAQILAEIAVMFADLEVEIDEYFMAIELANGQARVEEAAQWAEAAVADSNI